MSTPRIAIVISHPIQHFCPQYSSYAKCKEWEVKVFFASSLGLHEYLDKNFNQKIHWNNLKLEEFQHLFLNDNPIPVSAKLDAPNIEEELEKYGPDAIIVNGYFQKYQRRALQWAKRKHKKVFYISDSEKRQKRNPLTNLLKYPYLKNYFKNIDAFLTVGNANEEYYASYGVPSEKLFRTPFPIDISLYKRSLEQKDTLKNAVRKELKIDEHNLTCSVVGKLVQFKSQRHIIEALAKVRVPVTLLIIGSGPDSDSLKQFASKINLHQVIFTGFVDPLDLPKYYAATDIYLHPAMVEPHSLAISEAIYMGCPIIISNRCGSWGTFDDVQPGKNGFIYRWGDINQLGSLISKLIVDKELRKEFSEYSLQISRIFQQNSHLNGLKSALRQNDLL